VQFFSVIGEDLLGQHDQLSIDTSNGLESVSRTNANQEALDVAIDIASSPESRSNGLVFGEVGGYPMVSVRTETAIGDYW
jgi:hypothetical protein